VYAIDGRLELEVPEGEPVEAYGGMGYRINRPRELLRPSRALTVSAEQALTKELALDPFKRRYYNSERDLVPNADSPAVAIKEQVLKESTNVVIAEHHMIHLLKTSIPEHRLFTMESYCRGRTLHGLYPSHIQDCKMKIREMFAPTCDVVALHHRLRVQTMLQAKSQRGAAVVKVRVPAGILDITPLRKYSEMTHSFETGNRHGSIEVMLNNAEDINDTFGFDSFTAAVPITQPLEGMRGPHIASLLPGVGHKFAFNPTASMIELDLKPAWFSAEGRYEGGVKRPDPPDDGLSYIYHVDKRKWLVEGSPEGSDAPGSATLLCELMDGPSPQVFL